MPTVTKQAITCFALLRSHSCPLLLKINITLSLCLFSFFRIILLGSSYYLLSLYSLFSLNIWYLNLYTFPCKFLFCPLTMEVSDLKSFNLITVQKWYKFSRNQTSDFDLLGQQYAVQHSLTMLRLLYVSYSLSQPKFQA